jgi:hypothetical protein
MSSGSASASNEISASNQEDTGRAGGSRDPQYAVAKGRKKLRIVKSVDPTIAAKPKARFTKKPPYKRD